MTDKSILKAMVLCALVALLLSLSLAGCGKARSDNSSQRGNVPHTPQYTAYVESAAMWRQVEADWAMVIDGTLVMDMPDGTRVTYSPTSWKHLVHRP